MLTLSSQDLVAWVMAFLWPLTRILGLVAVAPLFGNASVPARVKVGLGVMLALIIAPTASGAAIDPLSHRGLLALAGQFVIGLAMGFAMRVVFSAVELAGEVAGLSMGLNFAQFFDPATQNQSTATSSFLTMLATLAFLAVDGHLLLISTLAESFQALPVGAYPLSGGGWQTLAGWGGKVFLAGTQLALPIVGALLITNLALGILTRAAPQLNLFGIGFPITLGVGLLLLTVLLPYLATPLERLFAEGIGMTREAVTSLAPR